jgi:hypothetical protein
MSVRSVVVRVALAALAMAIPSAATRPNAGFAEPANAPTSATRTAVVVKSWGGCFGDLLIWDALNANWPNYGSIPISIDYSHLGLCSIYDDVTLPELEASGADVVIVSDPSGGNADWTKADVSALVEYLKEGRDLIGTFLVFGYGNAELAPLFGVDSTEFYTVSETTPKYGERNPGLPLFRDVGDPYVSSGYAGAQVPSDGTWGGSVLTTAKMAAHTADSAGAILVRKARRYVSIYISTMPEYLGSTIDEQFFYNAIVFSLPG